MKIIKKTRRQPLIPVSAMSDIGFLLLIFIMLLSLMNYKKEIKIDYPESKYQEVTQKEKNFEIWIDNEGLIYNKNKIVDLKTLEGLLVDTIINNPDVRIHVIADKNTRYKNVDKVINILKLLQHREVSLVVKEIEK